MPESSISLTGPCNCCGVGCPACCDHAPRAIHIEISGLTGLKGTEDDSQHCCPNVFDCEAVNGTYELELTEPPVGDTCVWFRLINAPGTPLCQMWYMRLTISATTINFVVTGDSCCDYVTLGHLDLEVAECPDRFPEPMETNCRFNGLEFPLDVRPWVALTGNCPYCQNLAGTGKVKIY